MLVNGSTAIEGFPGSAVSACCATTVPSSRSTVRNQSREAAAISTSRTAAITIDIRLLPARRLARAGPGGGTDVPGCKDMR